MTPLHDDILDQREPMRGAFLGALGLHLAIVAAILLNGWIEGHTDAFGSKDAGGAVGIEAVDSIPLQHKGMPNPLANDTDSEVPQTKAKPVERVKAEPTPPDAVLLKSRNAKKKAAEVASERQRFRPFDQLEKNQLTSKSAPQVSNPIYSAAPGAGRVGAGANTTLGDRFAGYSAQIQQLVAQHWRTGDVDAHLQTAPVVVATFELLRNGSIRNVQILQGSNIAALDFSVKRAILDASPFPPIPAAFDRDYARVEFTFELKR
ncbi:MAG: TonB family protein [Bryobacteraceae bacterium]|jgi:TonB family protein